MLASWKYPVIARAMTSVLPPLARPCGGPGWSGMARCAGGAASGEMKRGELVADGSAGRSDIWRPDSVATSGRTGLSDPVAAAASRSASLDRPVAGTTSGYTSLDHLMGATTTGWTSLLHLVAAMTSGWTRF